MNDDINKVSTDLTSSLANVDSMGIVAQKMMSTVDDFKRVMMYYDCAILEVETKFKVLNRQFAMKREYNPIETIKTRLKSPESIFDKLKRNNLPLSAASIEENLYDVAGVRVICPFINDIYLLADCLLKQDDIRLLRIKDYIASPKPNGYRSLHLIVDVPIFLKYEKRMVKVEVQLRTIAMDFWASLEHRLRYKQDLKEDVLDLLADELKDCAEQSALLDQRMEKIKNVLDKSK